MNAKQFKFKLPVKVKAVDSYEEATAIYQAYRDANNLGSSKLRPLLLMNVNGDVVAHVSYNGRVWQGGDVMLSNKPEISLNQEAVKNLYNHYKSTFEAAIRKMYGL